MFFSCQDGSGKQIVDEYINSDGQNVTEFKVNDSITERELKRNGKLEAKEVENTKIDSIIIYYYDEFDKLYQSSKFSTSNKNSLIENCVYYENGSISEKYLKTQENEKLAEYFYNYYGKLIQNKFIKEGSCNPNSVIYYKSNGEIDFNKKNKFLSTSLISDSLAINVFGTDSKIFEQVDFYVVKDFNNYQMPYFISDKSTMLLSIKSTNTNLITVPLSALKPFKNKIKCVVSYGNRDYQGNWNYEEQEFYIESLLDIPETNLFPIRNENN